MEAAALKSHPSESAISVKIAGNLPELIDEPLPEIPIKEELIEEATMQACTGMQRASQVRMSTSGSGKALVPERPCRSTGVRRFGL
ncbi:hypothetical protein ACFX16_044461 [Malus domestica]